MRSSILAALVIATAVALLVGGQVAAFANPASPPQVWGGDQDPRSVVVEAKLPSPSFRVDLEVDRPNRMYQAGDLLNVRVHSERAGYLYLIYCDANKKAHLLFPNKFQTDNRVPAAGTVQVPGNSTFQLRVAAPFGMEVLAAVVTTNPLETIRDMDFSRGQITELSTDQVRGVLCECKESNPTSKLGAWGGRRVIIQTREAGQPVVNVSPTNTKLKDETRAYEKALEKHLEAAAKFRQDVANYHKESQRYTEEVRRFNALPQHLASQAESVRLYQWADRLDSWGKRLRQERDQINARANELEQWRQRLVSMQNNGSSQG